MTSGVRVLNEECIGLMAGLKHPRCSPVLADDCALWCAARTRLALEIRYCAIISWCGNGTLVDVSRLASGGCDHRSHVAEDGVRMTHLKLSPEEHNGIPSGYVSERIGRVLETHPSKGRGGELQRERCERNEQLLYKWSGADFVVTHAEVGKGTDVGERMYLDSPTDQAFFADEWCSHCAVELDVALVGPHA